MKSKVTLTAAALVLGLQFGAPAQAQDKTFSVWWWELPATAQNKAWTKGLEEFKAKHPDVTVSFELKTFDQMQKAGGMILNSGAVPDLTEYNKGNATAGLVASQGLLTPLDDVFKERGWGNTLNESMLRLSKYDEKGIFGSGPIIGVPAYGEYVSVFYNVDMFEANGLKVPKTLEEFEAVLDAFNKKGVLPLVTGTKDAPAQHLFATLAYTQADDTWIANYQGLKTPLDTKPFLWAAQKVQDWVSKGYISKDSTGMKGDDAVAQFMAGKSPMYISGTWNTGTFSAGIKTFKWDQFIFPTPKYSVGSTGSLFVVPANAKNKDLAYDFIDIVIGKANQTEQANAGGVALAADNAAVTDPVGKQVSTNFAEIAGKGGLGLYPDWPVPGYYETLIQACTGLIAGTTTPEDFVERLRVAYDDAQANQ